MASDEQHATWWVAAIGLAALAHALVTLALSLTRLYTDKVAIVDLGAVDQAISTTLHYGVPTTTIYPPFEVANWLGYLFTPIALLMVPVYAIAPFPALLLAVNSASIAAAAVPLFLACRRVLGRSDLAASWSLLYLLNPFVFGGALWEFHEKGLSVLAIALGAAAPALLLFVIMPALNATGGHPILEAAAGDQLDRYGWTGLTAAALPAALGELARQDATYLAALLVTTGGTAVLAPVSLAPGLADLAANLLSINPMPRNLSAYHSMALVPLFIIAGAQGSLGLRKRAMPLRLGLAPTLLLLYLFLPAPVPGSRNPWQVTSLRLHRDQAVGDIAALLPPELSLSAQANIGALFAHRLHVYRFPERVETADAVVLRLRMPYDPPTYAPFSNPYDPREMPAVFDAMEAALRDPGLGVRYWKDDWLVAVRGAADAVDRSAPLRRLETLRTRYEEGT